MSIRTSFNPMGTLGNITVEYLDEVALTKNKIVPSVFTSWRDLDDIEVSVTTRLTSIARFSDIFNLRPNVDSVRYKMNCESFRFAVYNNTSSYVYFATQEGRVKVSLDKRGASVNDVLVADLPNGHKSEGEAYEFLISPQRISEFAIKRNGALLAQWRAARVNNDDGLFDTISRQFIQA